MDILSMLGAVLSEDSVKSLSQAAGVSDAEVRQVLGAALPSLLNGAVAQAEDGKTADSFAGALNRHAAGDTSDLSAFLQNVDMEDGSKIVGHLLGSDSDAAIQEISRRAGVSAAGTGSVMSAAAPLLMSLLGQETGSQQQQQSSGNAAIAGIMGSLIKNVDLGSILSGLLGATGSGSGTTASAGGSNHSGGGGILGALGNLFK